jgi:hypothetical protein
MHIPHDAHLMEMGCGMCGMRCPFTHETDPPLTVQRAELWACLHQLVCPALCHCDD